MGRGGYELLFQELLPIAREAGEAILRVYNEMGVVGYQCKADLSPLTQADLNAHHVLARHLKPLLPGCCVVSEEDKGSHIQRSMSGRFWLIDPLDGTKEYIARNGEFTVNIALIEKGRSVMGVVYAPAIDTIYWGGGGLGAYRSLGADTAAIAVGNDKADGICRVVASKSHLNAETQAFIDRLGAASLIQVGSSLKICCVAEGAADIYPRLAPTCEWDTAAAQAILEGAGGAVVNLQGESLCYGKADILNPSFVAVRNFNLIPS